MKRLINSLRPAFVENDTRPDMTAARHQDVTREELQQLFAPELSFRQHQTAFHVCV